MKAQIRVLTCVVLCSLSLACSPVGKIVEARSESPGSRRGVKALATSTSARPEWRLVNLIMQRRAKWLLGRTDELFLNKDENKTAK